jgi:hypothetical protein
LGKRGDGGAEADGGVGKPAQMAKRNLREAVLAKMEVKGKRGEANQVFDAPGNGLAGPEDGVGVILLGKPGGDGVLEDADLVEAFEDGPCRRAPGLSR